MGKAPGYQTQCPFSQRARLPLAVLLLAGILCLSSCGSPPAAPADTASAPPSEMSAPEQFAAADALSAADVTAGTKTYAADLFFDASGNLDTDCTENLTLAFIGGSLTEGEITYDGNLTPHCTNGWVDRVLSYFSETFPRRYLRAYNAGISATTSDFGAARFQRCVLDYAPDVIFIEYAVNDSGFGKEKAQAYMEAMVRAARALDREPVVIFVYTPQPSEKSSSAYAAWRAGVDDKEEIANYYGIGTVNLYDALFDACASGGGGSFFSYLGRYFNLYSSETVYYDVHPRAEGYAMFGDAVVDAIASGPTKYLCRMKPVTEGYENGLYDAVTRTVYHHIAPDSDRLEYTGFWSFYDRYTPFNAYTTPYGGNVAIPLRSYESPNNEDGIAQTFSGGASVSFSSSAAGLYIQIPYAASGNSAAVSIDGRYAATVSCHLNFYGYTGAVFVALPDDGKTHEIRLVASPASPEYAVFRFGYFIELLTS